MQIVFNDYSIENQFDTYESFEDYFRSKLQFVLKIIIERKMTLYKVEEIISKPLIEGQPLRIVFEKANRSVLTQLKKYILKLLAAPFLDDELLTVDGIDYECPFSSEIPNCFTEAIERQCPVLSFQHESFEKNVIACKREGIDLKLPNILDRRDLLWNYLHAEKGATRYILENFPFAKRVELADLSGRCYAEELLFSLSTDDICLITSHIDDLIRDKSVGKKTRFWDSINTGKKNFFEYRLSISAGREFRLFFLWEEKLIFLNGFIKKTQETPKRELEKAVRIIRDFEL